MNSAVTVPAVTRPPQPMRRNRNLMLLVAANALSLTGNAAVPIGITFGVLELTGRGRDVALVLMAETVPMVLLVLFGGVWADRLERRRLMVVSDVVRAVSAATAGALLLTGNASIQHLVVLMAIYGSAAAFFQPAVAGLIPSLVPDRGQLHKANGLLMATSGMTWIVGPGVAAGLIAWTSPGAVFLFDAVTFVWSAAALTMMRLPAARVRQRDESMWRDLTDGWHEFTARSWVWMTIASVSVMFAFVIAPLNALGPVVADRDLGGAVAWALVVAGLSLGRVGGGVLAMNWLPERSLFWASALVLLQAPAMVALAIPTSLLVVVAANFIGGVGIGYFMSAWGTILQQRIPADRISRVNSYDWFGSLLAMPCGYLLVGFLVEPLGVSTLLYAATAAVLLAVVPLLLAPGVRRLSQSALDAPSAG